MEEGKNTKTRDELKTYFETGDFPTEVQFEGLLDGYTNLRELGFGIDVKPSAYSKRKGYHFYKALDRFDGVSGHKIVESKKGVMDIDIPGFQHVLSRQVFYKDLYVKLIGAIDIEQYQPKIIIERYKQSKEMPSGYKKPAGFYQEKPTDAQKWGRKSEYIVNAKEMILDLEPIHYFKPSKNYKEFLPSGSFNRLGSFKYSTIAKPFSQLRIMLQIHINGVAYKSRPIYMKVLLGTSGPTDAINFVLN